jgi:hypothetical protein
MTRPGNPEGGDVADPRSNRIHWRRILVESAAVILSILLAFSIDAWWDGHRERLHERELLAGLLTDFEASRPDLVHRLSLARRMADGTTRFLELTDGQTGTARIEVPDSLVLALLGGPTYEPATNTLDAAVASGEIELVRNDELREELARWRRILSDTGEDEREVRRITNEQIVPLLSRETNLHPYLEKVLPWSGGDPYGSGRLIDGDSPDRSGGRSTLTVSSELVGAIALRRFYVEFSAADLRELLTSLDRLTALLTDELDR